MTNGLLLRIVLVIDEITGWQLPVKVIFVSWYFWLSVIFTVKIDEEEREYPLIDTVKE